MRVVAVQRNKKPKKQKYETKYWKSTTQRFKELFHYLTFFVSIIINNSRHLYEVIYDGRKCQRFARALDTQM